MKNQDLRTMQQKDITQKGGESIATGFGDCTDEFMAMLEAQRKFDQLRHADIGMVYARNNSRAKIQMVFDAKILQNLEIIPKDLEMSNPETFVRISRSTVKAAASVKIKENPVKKILFEVDVLTGHATLIME